MFLKEFEIRWTDLDANRHLGNVSYMSYAADTRMSFLRKMGLSQKNLLKLGIGPVVFNEHFFSFKEVMPDEKIRVSLEVSGMSADGKFFEFEHNYFNEKGNNITHCEMMGGWMNLKTRKLTPLTQELISNFNGAYKSDSFKKLTSSDTRKWNRNPKDLF
jgi:acyl-CoA thioester hydrolase